MGVTSLSRDGIVANEKYSSALAGNDTADVALSSDFLISEVILNGTASSINFDVSTLAAQGYKHLQIRMIAKPSASSDVNTVLRFNSDTGTNYAWHYMLGDGGGIYPNAGANDTLAYINSIFGTKGASNYTATILDLLDFNGTKNKTVRSFYGIAATQVGLFSGLWRNTGAITSINVFLSSGSFATGSRFSLYGSKG